MQLKLDVIQLRVTSAKSINQTIHSNPSIMILYLNLNTKQWFVSYVQAGNSNGWSELELCDRLQALHLIELGYEITYTQHTNTN